MSRDENTIKDQVSKPKENNKIQSCTDEEINQNTEEIKPLRYYNEEHNIWLNLDFSIQEGNNSQRVIEILKNNYLKKTIMKKT